ncbi:hypothetical protein RI054_20g88290 [Pseudoscourfieldia marina]
MIDQVEAAAAAVAAAIAGQQQHEQQSLRFAEQMALYHHQNQHYLQQQHQQQQHQHHNQFWQHQLEQQQHYQLQHQLLQQQQQQQQAVESMAQTMRRVRSGGDEFTSLTPPEQLQHFLHNSNSQVSLNTLLLNGEMSTLEAVTNNNDGGGGGGGGGVAGGTGRMSRPPSLSAFHPWAMQMQQQQSEAAGYPQHLFTALLAGLGGSLNTTPRDGEIVGGKNDPLLHHRRHHLRHRHLPRHRRRLPGLRHHHHFCCYNIRLHRHRRLPLRRRGTRREGLPAAPPPVVIAQKHQQ